MVYQAFAPVPGMYRLSNHDNTFQHPFCSAANPVGDIPH
jgi:hypothetical protein